MVSAESTTGPLYQPFYCEENAWHLCQAAALADSSPHVVVVSSMSRFVVMWDQRAAAPEAPIAWDYHVFVVAHTGGWQAWDPDCRSGMPLSLGAYVKGTFATVGVQPPQFDPTFRVLTASAYCETLRSDRSHMREADGTWRAPPPEWPLISDMADGSNVKRFFDMADSFVGDRMGLDGLLARFGPSPLPM